MTGKVAIFRQSISPPRKVFGCKLADASGKVNRWARASTSALLGNWRTRMTVAWL